MPQHTIMVCHRNTFPNYITYSILVSAFPFNFHMFKNFQRPKKPPPNKKHHCLFFFCFSFLFKWVWIALDAFWLTQLNVYCFCTQFSYFDNGTTEILYSSLSDIEDLYQVDQAWSGPKEDKKCNKQAQIEGLCTRTRINPFSCLNDQTISSGSLRQLTKIIVSAWSVLFNSSILLNSRILLKDTIFSHA